MYKINKKQDKHSYKTIYEKIKNIVNKKKN